MGLIAIQACPVCGAKERDEASDGIASRKRDSGKYYLEYAAAKLGVSLDAALDAIKVYRCTTCQSYYCDPWISPETAAHIFTEGAPDHMAGWGNFEHWLSSAHPNAVEIANAKLYRLLEQKIGALKSYAEYGCPFQGFLLLFKSLETTPMERVNSFANAIKRKPDVRWSTGPRLHRAAQGLADRLAVGYHKLRAVKRGASAPRLSSEAWGLPDKRWLLTHQTTTAWGNNCVRYGASCSYYSSKMLGSDVLPFQEQVQNLEQERAETLDLLGVFNILDHTNDPVAVIKNGLKLARHIIVVTHHASLAGKQHLFAFHDSFPSWLTAQLENARIEDLTLEMIGQQERDYNYILISRNLP